MSAATVEKKDVKIMLCASCGIAGGDDIKLNRCDGCDLVRYCSVACQELHRPEHAGKCRKRAAELRDEILFKQPERSHWGDCPICYLPMPLDNKISKMMLCCSKTICSGCYHLQQKCQLCRKILPGTEEEINEQWMKQIEANDPALMCRMGTKRYIEGDYESAMDYWTKAAALGDVEAHYQLSTFYVGGKGVEKDEGKEMYHLKEAAIGGHTDARYNLGWIEEKRGRIDRAAKHYIIAAKLGDDLALKGIKDLYKAGLMSKEDFAVAISGHKAAIDATKSPQREAAAKSILRDEILFKQPEISCCYGECPICFLPMPLNIKKTNLMSCCGKVICNGCHRAQTERETEENLEHTCPFCREVVPSSEEEYNGRLMKRVEANDPEAICDMGNKRYSAGDYQSAFDYWTRAVALGNVRAHYDISGLYANGKGVEKDERKELHHLEEAAIGGCPDARFNLGYIEAENGQDDRAVKHWTIAAKLGDDESLEYLKNIYKAGLMSKDDFTAALRGYQAAIDAIKSPHREEAEKWRAERKREEALRK